MYPDFICDLPNEYAGFFTAFRMTNQGCFFWKIKPTLIKQLHLNSQTSILSVRKILHCVQNNKPRVFFWEIQPTLIKQLQLNSQFSILNTIIRPGDFKVRNSARARWFLFHIYPLN